MTVIGTNANMATELLARNNSSLANDLDYVFYTFSDESTGMKTTYKICLQTDANAICNNKERTTWLHVAAKAGQETMLRGFTKQGNQGLNLEVRNAEDFTPLMVALKADKEKSVEILLDAGADIHAKYKMESNYWSTALHLAAKSDVRIVQMIFKQRQGQLNWELEDSSHETPVYNAIRAKKTEIAEFLIENKVNIFHKVEEKNRTTNLLAAAAIIGNIKIVKLLLAKGLKVSECSLSRGYFDDSSNWQTRTLKASPIFGAVLNDCDEEMVEVLIAAGDDPHRILSDNSNILSWVNPKKNPKVLELFLKMKINPNQRSHHDGSTPLITATKIGTVDHVQLLLQYGADPNALGKDGKPALYSPCIGNNPDDADKIELLLNHGAKPNLKNAFGIFASYHTNANLSSRAFALTKLFLSKGAKIDEYSRKSFKASFLNNDEEFKQLLKKYDECVVM